MKFKGFAGLLLLSVSVLCGCGAKHSHNYELKVIGDYKTSYVSGESFDTTGMFVKKVCPDCGEEIVIEDYEIENNVPLLSGTDSLTINADGLSAQVGIDVEFQFNGTITCVGDSLTAGHNWPQEAYPVYINDYLPEGSKATVINCGHNGASFKNFGQYNPSYYECSEYTKSLQTKPDVITILLGTNDATNWANEGPTFEEDYRALIDVYKEKFGEDQKFILMTSPATKNGNQFGIPNDTIRDYVNPIQRDIAEDLEYPLIDLREMFENYGSLDDLVRPNDGVHFSVAAAKMVAEEIANALVGYVA
ncbi:MAG: SGNH/GDSL hydrolase family protein [Bacilli bacterium]|nr:SGNH/GDSL hydrolase family protein [Bacilli bacterium]